MPCRRESSKRRPSPRAVQPSRPAAALLLALCASLPAAGAENSAGAPASPWKWTVEAVVDAVAVSGTQISPDGRQVVFTRSRWRGPEAKPGAAWTSLWLVPFEGGDARRLTWADAEDQRPRWSPDGTRIAFLSKRASGDKAKTQVWILPVAGGEPWAATDEKAEVAAFEWSPDGAAIAYVAVDPKSEEREKAEKAGRDENVAEGDLRPRRLWILDLESGKAEPLASLGDLSAWEFDWAPDGSALAATITDRNRTDDAYLMKRIVVLPRAGSLRELVPAVGKIAEIAWSRDGKTLAWVGGVDASDPAAGSLFAVPAAGGAPANLSGAREETVTGIAWRRDGRLAVSAASGTRSAIHLVDVAAGTWETAVAPGPIVFSSATWSADGMRYAMTAATRDYPNDVHAGTLAPPPAPRPKKKGTRAAVPSPAPEPIRRLADSNPRTASLPRARQETIRYAAKDGLAIEAVLVRPAESREGTPTPLVVVAHGGPESHWLDAWLNGYGAPAQLFAERGWTVLFPNYRGSTGRGVGFSKADHKDLGGRELTDLLDGIDHLAAKGWIDPKRVGIMGGSYGGYFTALGVTRYSDRFAAGVDFFGISSWESFMGQSDIPVENASVHWNLWCYDHADLCRERSAIGNLDRARTPTLILQGEKDERVPRAQSDELHAALRWKKVPVEYVVYPREGHGFREREHRIDALARTVRWFETWLKP